MRVDPTLSNGLIKTLLKAYLYININNLELIDLFSTTTMCCCDSKRKYVDTRFSVRHIAYESLTDKQETYDLRLVLVTKNSKPLVLLKKCQNAYYIKQLIYHQEQ